VAPPLERVPPAAYGGTERVIDELARQLVQRGHAVTLFASADSTSSGALVPTVRTPLRARGDERDPTAAFLVTLARMLPRAPEFDLLHAHVDLWSLVLAETSPVPVVATFHSRLDAAGVGMRLARSRAHPVAISEAQAHQPDPPLADWVHNGLSLEQMPFGPDAGDDLVFVGRMTADKGVADAIEVARRSGRRLRIIAKIPYLAIERDYYDGVVKPALRRADIEELGELGQDDRDRVVAESHALIMPSVWPEPFGLTAIEAMACGTPVIARDVGALPEIVRQGRDGFLAADAAGMAAALDGVAALDRAAIRRGAIERFSAARMADGYERIYSRILGATHSRTRSS
jgi:glycosyltransferase involved in cell wall biosynthesis